MINPEDITDFEYSGDDGHQCKGAYLIWAETADGEVTEKELDYLNSNCLSFFHEDIMQRSVEDHIDRAELAYDLERDREIGL